MHTKYLKALLANLILSGIISFIYLVFLPLDISRGSLINYGLLRSLLLAAMAAAILVAGAVLVRLYSQSTFGSMMVEKIDRTLATPHSRLFHYQFGLIVGLIFLVEAFLLSWFVIPVPARPLILWMTAACLLIWIMLRTAYREIFKSRPSLLKRLKDGWKNWPGTQKKVLIVLVLLGLVYFAAFIPLNSSGRPHPDEEIIYPEVVNMLIAGDSITETLQDSFIISSWWYGYPYFPMSALMLVIPRLIFGTSFGEQVNLNLLLLRQFISVLPMVVSLIFLVYLVDGFRHFWASIAMFVVLALIPGVVHYNTRFWHPDSIIVLLVLLSIWLLKRDKLRFGRNFYLAAFTIGLNAVIKIWGFFFFLAIGGYLLAGLISRKLDLWKMVKAGIFFILVMAASIIITSPSILIPWNLKTYISELQEYYPVLRQGYDEPDPQGVYRLGLAAWMVFFRMHFMQDFYFYFSLFAVGAGSLLGRQKTLNRLILAWCAVVGTYLVGWVAVKSFQYMLPLMIPLYGAVFMLPQIAGGMDYPRLFGFLAHPKAKWVLTGIVIVMTAVQFYFNLKLFPI